MGFQPKMHLRMNGLIFRALLVIGFNVVAICLLGQNGPITLSIIEPKSGGFAGIDLKVIVAITSTYELQSVKASSEGREANLTFSDCAYEVKGVCYPGWVGSISLSGLVRGDKLLTVVATDVRGNQAQGQQIFIYDQKPILTVSAPRLSMVARPFVHVTATCVDDDPDGCKSISVFERPESNNLLLASGKSGIDQNVALHGKGTLRFVAVDSRGQTSSEDRSIYFDSSPSLIEVDRIGDDGAITIRDLQDDRILFIQELGNIKVLKILQPSTNQLTVIPTPALDGSAIMPEYGFLTPKGAVFVAGDLLSGGVFDWRDGSLEKFGLPNSHDSLRVKGNYAIWTGEKGNKYTGQIILFLRDLLSGMNTEIVTPVGNYQNDVSSNGDVVYWGVDFNIYRYRWGVITKLTNDTNLWNTYPITDGINILYRKHTPCCNNQTYSIILYGSSGELILAPARQEEPSPGSDYQVNNGHVAFTKPGIDGKLQVWIDSRQASDFGTSSRIDFLAPNGESTFVNSNQLYFYRPGSIAAPISSDSGQRYSLNGQWFAAIGRSLFKIDPDMPWPSLLSLYPDSAIVGSPAFTLTVNGANFLKTATVALNGENRPTTFVNSTRLTAEISANDLAVPGNALISVIQVPFGGATSNMLSFAINRGTCPTISLMPSTLPNGTVGSYYYQVISASGGESPYQYSISSGTWPAWLNIGTAGILSGTPTVSGTLSFTVKATDANSCGGSQDYMLTISPASGLAEITGPTPSSTLTSTVVPFTWTTGIGVTQYWLSIGRNVGGKEYYNNDEKSNLSALVMGLPNDASTLYVRLWSLVGSNWLSRDYTYNACSGCGSILAQITSPSPGPILISTTVTFQWNTGTGVTQYWLSIGKSPGGAEIYDKDQEANLSARVSNLPNDGGTIYVRLWSRVIGYWAFNDYTFKACSGCGFGVPGKATLVSPSGTIVTDRPTYVWQAVSSATWYQLWVNDSATSPKIKAWYTLAQAGCAAGTGTCSVTPATALALGSGQWWIQTWNDSGDGPWSDPLQFTVVTGDAPGKATLVSPTGTITTTTPPYIWNAVSTATWYYLWVNDSAGVPRIQAWYTAGQAGCASGTGLCSVTPGTGLALGSGQWWIQTWNDTGYGPWSDPLQFVVAAANSWRGVP